MMLTFWFRISRIAALVTLFAIPAQGQERMVRSTVVMSHPIVNADRISPLNVKEVDASNRKARLAFDERAGEWHNIPRGESLLLVQDQKTGRLSCAIRGNVTEILEKGEAIFEFGAEATRELRPGPVILLYPFEGRVEFGDKRAYPVTSKKFRELPEVIRTAAEKPDDGGDAIEIARQRAAHSKSKNNLSKILLAMHQFHSVHGHFPPAVIHGPDGEPWHSWRVLILPYLDHEELHRKYDYSKPWNSPENKEVVDTVLDIYKDPAYGDSAEPVTHYAAIVGAKTMFRPNGARIEDLSRPLANMSAGGTKLFEITDGTSATLTIAPVADEPKIPWAKPEDLSFGPDFPELGKPGGIALPHRSLDGDGRVAPIAKADGSVTDLNEETPLRIVRSLITISGGEIYEAIPNVFPADEPAVPKTPIFVILKNPDGSYSAKIE